MARSLNFAERTAIGCYRFAIGLVAPFVDRKFLDPAVPISNRIAHSQYFEYLVGLANKPGARILEIGSREVTGESSARAAFTEAEYIGFDFYEGPNVDVVGDAHKLTDFFPGQRFDLIYSSAVFEHLAMPWIVAAEINKLLKVGGYVFVETHFSYSSHERPWHFFQFSDMALRVLFPPAMGIKCIEAGVSNPMIGRFSALADKYLRYRPVGALYCHSEFLGRKEHDMNNFRWDELELGDIVGNSRYPSPH